MNDFQEFAKLLIPFFALVGALIFFLGLRRLWRRRLFWGSLEGLTGLLILSLAVLAGALIINLYTYDRLTREAPVAEVYFRSQGPQRFWAYVLQPEKAIAVDLRGDEWQLDARILKWQGTAVLLGLDTVYRLERLSGRYRDIRQERSQPRTVYGLSEDPGLDLWTMARKHSDWIPWVDAVYGSATYLPMAEGAQFAISVSTTGLLARPGNTPAEEAVRKWP